MILTNIDLVLSTIQQVLLATLTHFLWLFSALFVFGFLLYLFARLTRITFAKISGKTLDIFITGWIGTPVHELGHALFCLVFRHRIQEIKLYSPNSIDGTLGYVKHSYDSKSLYQNIGNFFIGTGPIILGSVVIYLLMIFFSDQSNNLYKELLKNSSLLVDDIYGKFSFQFNVFKDSLVLIFQHLINSENLGNYMFWIFIYLSISISAHMELSPFDIRSAWKGLLSIVLFLLTINSLIYGLEAAGLITSNNGIIRFFMLESYETHINYFLGVGTTILFYATIVSGINFLLTYLLLNIYNLLRGRGLVNPLW